MRLATLRVAIHKILINLAEKVFDRILSNLRKQILQNLTILFSQNLTSYMIEIKQVILQNTCVQTVECTFCRTEATK